MNMRPWFLLPIGKPKAASWVVSRSKLTSLWCCFITRSAALPTLIPAEWSSELTIRRWAAWHAHHACQELPSIRCCTKSWRTLANDRAAIEPAARAGPLIRPQLW